MISLNGVKVAIALRPGEPGHQSCGIALAKRLAACGAEVTFLGMADDRAPIESAGFSFIALSEGVAPLGTVPRETELTRLRTGRLGAMVQDIRWLSLHRRIILALPESRSAILAAQFDLVICDYTHPISAFVALGLGLRCILLDTTLPLDNRSVPPTWTTLTPSPEGSLPLRARLAWLREDLGNFQDLVAPILGLGQHQLARRFVGNASPIRTFAEVRRQFPRIVACPPELDFPSPRPPHWFYIDALVDLERAREPFSWDAVPADRDVVYIAMGTQTWLIKGRDRLFAMFLETAAAMPDVHFILAAGDAKPTLGPAPLNMTLVERAPQLAVLSRAVVMVTHAGLNSVKECISMGVPMVALPVDREQPGNAARVAYHKLGVALDYRTIDASKLRTSIEEVRSNPMYRTAVRRMREDFEACRIRNEVVDVIADCLARSESTEARSVRVSP